MRRKEARLQSDRVPASQEPARLPREDLMQVLSRPPSGMPALVLNADYRPLSYYPLSLWPWQEVIKAVFLERVEVVSTYDHVVHSPSFEMKLPSVVSLKQYVPQDRPPAFTRFNLFLRDTFSCQYCSSTMSSRAHGADARPGRTSSRPVRPAICGRAGERLARRVCTCSTRRAGPACMNFRIAAAASRQATCTPAGSTISTGISSWRREAALVSGDVLDADRVAGREAFFQAFV